MKIEQKDFNWVKENARLYFLDDIHERLTWAWSYNRLTEEQKQEVFEEIQKLELSI